MREITRVGSASIATDGGGNVIANSDLAYKPFGGVLGGGAFANDKTLTDKRTITM